MTRRLPTLLPTEEDVQRVLTVLHEARWIGAGTRAQLQQTVLRHAAELYIAFAASQTEEDA
jgi:hypothetical protein